MFQKNDNLVKTELLISGILDKHGSEIVIERTEGSDMVFYNSAAKALREEIKSLYDLAFIDGLTQIPNRMMLREIFSELEQDITAGKKCGVIAIFDMDHFKKVNDTYGHHTGDVLLQKLAEQIQNIPNFGRHLFRLGGDEFSLLFVADSGALSDSREHFAGILSAALGIYTLPSIDLECTISMGAALFPQHGDSFSTLLHRADIALYKAKSAGRNRLEFFEDEDDMIQDLKDVYINILPILDGDGNTFGYELTEGSSNKDKEKDKSAPRASLIEFNRTLDVLGIDEMDNNHLYFVNYSKNMAAVTGQNRLMSKIVIQLNITSHCTEEELMNYSKLKELGFSIALIASKADYLTDDIVALAKYVKIAPHQNSAEDLMWLISNNEKITYIGSHINNARQLAYAKKVGCTLYQGHYFKESTVVTKKTKSIEPIQANYYRLLKMTCTGEYVDFDAISEIIASDLALSFKLLKLMNSVAMGTREPISSIPMALAYLGEERLKKWIALMSLRGITTEKPIELIRISLIRAKFGENLVSHFKVPRNADHVFMVGMLSMLHVALDKEQKELIDEIALAPDIRDSLLTKNGKYSDMLIFFRNYEFSHWSEISKFAKDNGLSTRIINEAYLAATKWYDELTQER